MNLRPYQQRAVSFLEDKQRAFVVAPAGSGKTIMAAAALKNAMRPDSRSILTEHATVIWLANTKEQVQQAQDAAEKFGLRIDAHCVAAQPDCSLAHIVIVDEAHHMPAATWRATVGRAQGVVWGFSATPWSGDPERDEVLKKYFQNFITIPRDEVLDHGSITRGVVVIHDIDYPGEFEREIGINTALETERRCRRFPFIKREEHERRARWQATSEAVRDNPGRNSRITNLANGETGSVLVLVSSIEHGAYLQEGINGSELVHSKLAKSKRAQAIDNFRSGALRCMIATSLADEGLDVPRASVLVLAAGGRSAGKLEQRAGRVMRPHASKQFGTVHDFVDRGASLAYAQHLARLRTYRRLGYEIIRNPERRAA